MLIFEAFKTNLVNRVLNPIQILTLNNFGVHGGVTWWTRKMVEVMLTTLITGSPRGLGDDPELKVQIYIRIVVMRCLQKVIMYQLFAKNSIKASSLVKVIDTIRVMI